MALGRLHAANGGGKVIAVQGIPVEVHFTPPPAELLDGAAVMVIDVLRATTVQATLLDGGAEAMYPVADWGAAESLRRELPGAKLIGERGALPPPEADFGNSPTEFAAMDVRGWTVVHVTSNGTGALERAAGASFAVSACLRNLKAAAEAIFAHAQAAGGGIAIVCAGDNGGTTPSLEDGFAAGRALVALELARIGQRFVSEFVSDWVTGPAVYAGAFFLGLAYGVVNAPAQTLLHRRAPAEMRGRLFTAQFMIANAISMLALVVVAGVNDSFGVQYGLVLLAAIIAGLTFASLWLGRGEESGTEAGLR